MDWRNEEIDQSSVDSFSADEKDCVKSKSYLNLPGLEDCDIRSQIIEGSKCFTSAFENLKLDAGTNHEIDKSPFPESKVEKNSPFEYNFEAKSPLRGFQTHGKCSYRLVIQGSDILNYQAPCWKKDSRKWLWKSVRYARRKNKTKCSVNHNWLNNRHGGFKQRAGPSKTIN